MVIAKSPQVSIMGDHFCVTILFKEGVRVFVGQRAMDNRAARCHSQSIPARNRSEYEYLVPEVNSARVWAGVHFRDDMLAGNIIGAEAAAAVVQRVHLDGSPGDRAKRVLGRPLVTSAFFGDGGPNY